MKKLIFLFVFQFTASQLIGQPPIPPDNAVSNGTLKKQIKDDVQYLLFGENSATNGIELTLDEPEVRLTGIIPSERGIVSLDLKFGIKDNIATLFSNNKFNKKFSTAITYNYLPEGTTYSFDYRGRLTRELINAKREEVRVNLETQIMIYESLIRAHFPDLELDRAGQIVFNQSPFLKSTVTFDAFPSFDTIQSDSELIVEIVKGISKDIDIKESDSESDIIEKWIAEDLSSQQVQKLFGEYVKLKNYSRDIPSNLIEYELNVSKDIWVAKNIYWFSFSGFYEGTDALFYDTDILQRTSNFLSEFGAVAAFNNYYIDERAVYYIRIAAEIARRNNLDEFKKVGFIETDSLGSSSGKRVVTETKGDAYTDNTFMQAFEFGIDIEAYALFPKKTFMPGFYFRSALKISEAYKDGYRVPLELGLAFNIISKKDDENNFTLLPHLRWRNLFGNSASEFSQGNLSFGIRLSIPITIDKI